MKARVIGLWLVTLIVISEYYAVAKMIERGTDSLEAADILSLMVLDSQGRRLRSGRLRRHITDAENRRSRTRTVDMAKLVHLISQLGDPNYSASFRMIAHEVIRSVDQSQIKQIVESAARTCPTGAIPADAQQLLAAAERMFAAAAFTNTLSSANAETKQLVSQVRAYLKTLKGASNAQTTCDGLHSVIGSIQATSPQTAAAAALIETETVGGPNDNNLMQNLAIGLIVAAVVILIVAMTVSHYNPARAAAAAGGNMKPAVGKAADDSSVPRSSSSAAAADSKSAPAASTAAASASSTSSTVPDTKTSTNTAGSGGTRAKPPIWSKVPSTYDELKNWTDDWWNRYRKYVLTDAERALYLSSFPSSGDRGKLARIRWPLPAAVAADGKSFSADDEKRSFGAAIRAHRAVPWEGCAHNLVRVHRAFTACCNLPQTAGGSAAAAAPAGVPNGRCQSMMLAMAGGRNGKYYGSYSGNFADFSARHKHCIPYAFNADLRDVQPGVAAAPADAKSGGADAKDEHIAATGGASAVAAPAGSAAAAGAGASRGGGSAGVPPPVSFGSGFQAIRVETVFDQKLTESVAWRKTMIRQTLTDTHHASNWCVLTKSGAQGDPLFRGSSPWERSFKHVDEHLELYTLRRKFPDGHNPGDSANVIGNCAGARVAGNMFRAGIAVECLAEMWYDPANTEPVSVASTDNKLQEYRNGQFVPSCYTCQGVIPHLLDPTA